METKEVQPLDLLHKNPFYHQELSQLSKSRVTTQTPKEVKACWYCTHNMPKQCFRKPIHFDQRTQKYTVQGIYCTLNCVKKSIMENPAHSRLLELLTKMAIEIYGYMDHIHPAPEREQFTKFGGHIRYQTWFKTQGAAPTQLRSAPFVDSTMVIEYNFQDRNQTRRAMIANAMQDEPKKQIKKKTKSTKKPATLASLLR